MQEIKETNDHWLKDRPDGLIHIENGNFYGYILNMQSLNVFSFQFLNKAN